MGVHLGVRDSEIGGIFHFGEILGVFDLALTETEIRRSKSTNRPYKMSDSGGLHLLITPAGGKLWRWKYRFDGAEKSMALGRYPDVPIFFNLLQWILDFSLSCTTAGRQGARYRQHAQNTVRRMARQRAFCRIDGGAQLLYFRTE